MRGLLRPISANRPVNFEDAAFPAEIALLDKDSSNKIPSQRGDFWFNQTPHTANAAPSENEKKNQHLTLIPVKNYTYKLNCESLFL
jgi:hypothetical protein